MLAATLALFVVAVPLPPQPPGVSWPTLEWPRAPEAEWEPRLDRAFAEPDPSRPRYTHAVLVVRGGVVVAERYRSGVDARMPLPGWSMGKTATAVVAGMLVGQGRLRTEPPLGVPGWEPPDPRAAIGLGHLLQMSSGLSWRENYLNPVWSDVLPMMFGSGRHDMAAFAARRPLADPPGTRWAYSGGSTLVVCGAIVRAAGGPAQAQALFRESLFAPLGMRTALLETDGAGTPMGASYFFASAEDFARLGLLLLRDGVWEGRRLLPAGWVDFMRTPAPAAERGQYGAGVWLNAPPSDRSRLREMPSVPSDLFYASGKDGQYIVVVPSRDLVIVRLGTTPMDSRWSLEAFLRDLLGG